MSLLLSTTPRHANIFAMFRDRRGQSVDDSHEQPAAQNYSDRLQSGETHGPAGELQCLHGPGNAKINVMLLFSKLEF